MPDFSEGLSTNITFELLALERLFDDPKLIKYKQLIILALQKDVHVQRLVHTIILNEKHNLETITAGCSNNILDALLQGLTTGESHDLTLLPYTAPTNFDIEDAIQTLSDRLRHHRYKSPQAFTDRIKTVLLHASDKENRLPKDLIYSIFLFIMEHTTANDNPGTKSKWQDTISEKFLQGIEFEIRRRSKK